jgi:arylsulfatase A
MAQRPFLSVLHWLVGDAVDRAVFQPIVGCNRLAVVVSIAAMLAMSLSTNAQAQPATPPNIVFILADDMGYGDLGITGQNARAAQGLPSFSTPNIDSIAQAGVQFKNMYTGAPSCTPSRLTLLTGFHQGHVISDRAEDKIDVRGGELDKTWGQMLQQAGYETGMYGKWHLGGFAPSGLSIRSEPALPNNKGFEQGIGNLGEPRVEVHWEVDEQTGFHFVETPREPTWPGPGPPRQHLDPIMADHAAAFIRNKSNGGQPFAAYVPLTGPHTPYEQIPQDHPYINMPWAKGPRDYAGSMYYLDKHVGEILNAIDDPNGDGDTSDSVANNTIVIFASDNGPALANTDNGYTPEFFDSNSVYTGVKFISNEGGIRTPFLVRWPEKIAPGTVNDSFIGTFADIVPTFAELTGQETPLGIDGKSMLSELTGDGPSERPDALVWSQWREIGPSNPGNFAVRVGDWKLIKRRPTTTNPNTTYRLYNIDLDPRELTDRSAARPDIVAALEAIGIAEGYERESTGIVPNVGVIETRNTYFTQYKSWNPAIGNSDFFAAANWSGGTQYNEYVAPGATTLPPEAIGWNTGPVDNWLALMTNATNVDQSVDVSQNAKVLALGLQGDSEMRVNVLPTVQLRAQNGFRIAENGVVRLEGGELNTVRTLEVRAGGKLEGHGLVTGQQSLVAGIPEFANMGLFAPEVVNSGVISIDGGFNVTPMAGELQIDGDFSQEPTGMLSLELFGRGDDPGVDFDKLSVTGSVTLAGILSVSFGAPITPLLGDAFDLITVGGGLSGTFSGLVAPSLGTGLAWALDYTSSMAQLKVVESDGTGNEYLTIWKASFGINADGDLDGDGDTDGADFLAWQRQPQQPLPLSPATSSVPEPTSAFLAACVVLAGRGFRRDGNRLPKPLAC